MTTPQPQYILPAAAAVSGLLNDNIEETDAGVPVGAGDVEADRARAGASDANLDHVPRDIEDVPVGRADAEEDARRSGADPDAI